MESSSTKENDDQEFYPECLKTKWSEFIDSFLKLEVHNFSNHSKIWLFCEGMTGIPGSQCMKRYSYLTGKKSKKKSFTETEDAKILELFEKYGVKWSKIAKELKTRTRKQVRERYLNFLSNKVEKRPFTKEEDEKIREYYLKYGNKWAFIS